MVSLPQGHAAGKASLYRRFFTLTTIFSWVIFYLCIRLNTRPTSRHQPSPRSLLRGVVAPPHCVHILANDTPPHDDADAGVVAFNARTVCVIPSFCLLPRTFHHPAVLHVRGGDTPSNLLSRATCSAFDPSLSTRVSHVLPNCSRLLDDTLCAQAHHNGSDYGQSTPCPTILDHTTPLLSFPSPFAAVSRVSRVSVAVIVPPYAYMLNIYHYAQALLAAVQATASLQRLSSTVIPTIDIMHDVTVVFRGLPPWEYGMWQGEVTDAIMQHRLSGQFKHLRVTSTFEDDFYNSDTDTYHDVTPRGHAVCADVAIVLGARYHATQWLFANGHSEDNWPFSRQVAGGSCATSHNDSVALEAVAFRRAVYDHTGVETRIPKEVLQAGQPGFVRMTRMVMDLPGDVLLYASRNSLRDPVGEEDVLNGTTRRLSDADDEWVRKMLSEEAGRVGMKLKIVKADERMSFERQVKAFRQAGVIFGIHGANLVNAALAPAFATLVEVSLPTNALQCYVGGMHSGLGYVSYRPRRRADRRESWCARAVGRFKRLCWQGGVFRRVLLQERRDRDGVRAAVRTAVLWNVRVRRRFVGMRGVPTRWDDGTGEYVVDWDWDWGGGGG